MGKLNEQEKSENAVHMINNSSALQISCVRL